VPWLQVYGEGTQAFTSSLTHETGSVVQHSQHRHYTRCLARSTSDEGTSSTRAGHGDPDTTRLFGDNGAVLDGVENAVQRIFLQTHQETGRHLGAASASVLESGGSVRADPATHEVLSLESGGEIRSMDAESNAHPQLLWPLQYFSRVFFDEVTAHQCLYPEEVLALVSRLVQFGLNLGMVVFHDLVQFVTHQRTGFSGAVQVGLQLLYASHLVFLCLSAQLV